MPAVGGLWDPWVMDGWTHRTQQMPHGACHAASAWSVSQVLRLGHRGPWGLERWPLPGPRSYVEVANSYLKCFPEAQHQIPSHNPPVLHGGLSPSGRWRGRLSLLLITAEPGTRHQGSPGARNAWNYSQSSACSPASFPGRPQERAAGRFLRLPRPPTGPWCFPV